MNVHLGLPHLHINFHDQIHLTLAVTKKTNFLTIINVLYKFHPGLHTCRGNMHATIFSTISRAVCFVDGRCSYWGSQHSTYLPVAAIDKNGPGRTNKTSADRRANARGRYQHVPAV